MTFLEPIIAAVVGAAAAALAMLLRNSGQAQAFLKYGGIVKRAYDIIDPVLDQNLHNWKGSQVDMAFELAISSVADGALSSEEIKKLAFYMAQAWLPGKAADKVRQLEAMSSPAPELMKASEIATKVNNAAA
jgi:uncharacterized membrane protein